MFESAIFVFVTESITLNFQIFSSSYEFRLYFINKLVIDVGMTKARWIIPKFAEDLKTKIFSSIAKCLRFHNF